MYNPKAKANALAIVGALFYIICAGWVMLSKSSFIVLFSTWTHSVDLSALPSKTPDLMSVLIGFITFTIAVWIAGYLFAIFYNFFEKGK